MIGDGPRVQWRWTSTVNPSFGLSAPCGEDSRGTCRLELDAETGAAAVYREDEHGARVWSRPLDPVFVGAGQLAVKRSRVLVLRYSQIASGASLHALDVDSGAPLWTSALQALGPVGHSQYLNRAQLRVDVTEGRATVYGWELDTRYVEELELSTGNTVLNGRFAAPLASLSWRWTPRDVDPRDRVALDADDGRYLYTPARGQSPARLVKDRLGGGAPLWERALADAGTFDTVALLEHAGALWVVRYSPIASGATLLVLDASTGRSRRERALLAIGPVDHSKYRNELQLRVEHGHVIVTGRESEGRYVEALDPADASSSASLVFLDELTTATAPP